MGLVGGTETKQRRDGGDRQCFGGLRGLCDRHITPIHDAQVGEDELAAIIDAACGQSGDAQTCVDDVRGGVGRRIDTHLDHAAAHGQAQQRAVFIQRRQRAAKTFNQDSLVMKTARGEVVIGRRSSGGRRFVPEDLQLVDIDSGKIESGERGALYPHAVSDAEVVAGRFEVQVGAGGVVLHQNSAAAFHEADDGGELDGEFFQTALVGQRADVESGGQLGCCRE